MTPALYRARVMHLRRLPDGVRTHRFAYRVFRLLLDLDAPETAPRLLSRNRFNLLSLHDRDHGPRDGTPLRPWADTLLAEHGIPRPARIVLYTFPRVLGYAFNPLSMYLATNEDGTPTAVIYEVRNTDTDITHYVFHLDGSPPHRHAAPKHFYVSPFISPEQTYAFTLGEAGETIALRIRVDAPGEALTMIATENAAREPLTDRAILATCAALPFMTLKIVAGIYWEAVRLRLKGARFFRHPGNRGRYAPAASGPEP